MFDNVPGIQPLKYTVLKVSAGFELYPFSKTLLRGDRADFSKDFIDILHNPSSGLSANDSWVFFAYAFRSVGRSTVLGASIFKGGKKEKEFTYTQIINIYKVKMLIISKTLIC